MVRAFAMDLFERLETSDANLVCSPFSIAAALAMTRNGARGTTGDEMDAVLHAPQLAELNTSMNSLISAVEDVAGEQTRADGSTATVSVEVANSLWGQLDRTWEPDFLDALAVHFAAGMRLVDYEKDRTGAINKINEWVSDRTHERIKQTVDADLIEELTALVLVNTVYLKAPWEMPFTPSLTRPHLFTRADGSAVAVDLMTTSIRLHDAMFGSGWQAARLPYAGTTLAMTVVVPDLGELGSLAELLGADGLEQVLVGFRDDEQVKLEFPMWRLVIDLRLSQVLIGLGMAKAFQNSADLSGMSMGGPPLRLRDVVHKVFIAVDEMGTEAAAVTAVVVQAVSARPPPRVFTVDRSFYFVIHDVVTGTPLFLGRVNDPSQEH